MLGLEYNHSLKDDKYIRLAKELLLVGEDGSDKIFEYLDVLNEGLKPNEKRKKKVVIVGAGIAGLLSGHLLKQAGHEVQIIEANPHRIGGRIKTFKEPNRDLRPPFRNPNGKIPFANPDLYGEAGAMRLPSIHPLVLTLVDKLKLKRRLFFNVSVKDPKKGPFKPVEQVKYTSPYSNRVYESPYIPDYTYQDPPKTNTTFINTNSSLVRKNQYNSSDNPEVVKEINEGFHMRNTASTTSELLKKALDPIRKYTEKESGEELIKGWADVIEKYDKHSMWSFLKEEAKMSDEEIEGIGTIENLTSRMALSFFHSYLGRSDINPDMTYWELVGGTEQLPYAFLDDLKENIVLNRRLVRLEYERDSPEIWNLLGLEKSKGKVYLQTVNEVNFADGTVKGLDNSTEKEFDGDCAILTLPFSSLRHVQVSPPFSYKKRRAITELHYDAATKVLLEFSHRWWEMDTEEFGEALKERKQELAGNRKPKIAKSDEKEELEDISDDSEWYLMI